MRTTDDETVDDEEGDEPSQLPPISMNEDERRRYVEAALVANGYRFAADGRSAIVDAVVEQFARIEAIAATFVDEPLPIDAEPAVVFRP